MILQYRGFNKNLVYEEVDGVVTANVSIPTFSEKELGDSDKWNEAYRSIDEKIRKETNAANISGRTTKPLHEAGEVKVVISRRDGKDEAYLFDVGREVYLLNDKGKTMVRL